MKIFAFIVEILSMKEQATLIKYNGQDPISSFFKNLYLIFFFFFFFFFNE
jgi:hypothetical protein